MRVVWMGLCVMLASCLYCLPAGATDSPASPGDSKAAGNDTSLKTSAEIRQELLSLDYSDVLASSGFITLEQAQAATGDDAWLRICAEMAQAQIKRHCADRQLSGREYGMLIGWNLPGGGNNIPSRSLLMLVEGYLGNHGRLPASSAELLPPLMTNEGWAEFSNLSREEQVRRLNCVINPITGKVFDSFVNPQWVRGGVNIEVIDDQQEILRRFGSYANGEVIVDRETGATVPANRLVVTTFYGEDPGSVLCQMVQPRAI